MIHALLAAEAPASAAFLGPGERERFASIKAPRRQADFLLGRWTAKRLVAGILQQAPDSSIEVLAMASGQPRVFLRGEPVTLTLSLSHREGVAFAAADDSGAPLGADLERIEPRSGAFVRDFFTAAEQAAVTRGAPDLLANLIWSAKESALKALGEGLRMDTRSVEVQLEPPVAGPWQRFDVHGAADLCGYWRREGESILTLCGPSAQEPLLRIELGATGG